MAYIQVTFDQVSDDLKNILIAKLADRAFEGFEEEGLQLKAYVKDVDYDEPELALLARQYEASYTTAVLEDTNWNQVWESNFQPVTVDDFCNVRAHFHEPAKDVKHEIVITPKMSFGTGHHPTTHMMIRQMASIDFTNKVVMDFGTGTGVLAILADKLGAREIIAIDNDDWCIENANENVQTNMAARVHVQKGDTAAPSAGSTLLFDIILANITRNIILENMDHFVAHLQPQGTLLLSGLLEEDEAVIVEKAAERGLRLAQKLRRANWLCLQMRLDV